MKTRMFLLTVIITTCFFLTGCSDLLTAESSSSPTLSESIDALNESLDQYQAYDKLHIQSPERRITYMDEAVESVEMVDPTEIVYYMYADADYSKILVKDGVIYVFDLEGNVCYIYNDFFLRYIKGTSNT